MRINISITTEDLQLIDDYCNSTGIKRSTFLTRSALKEVGVHEKDIEHGYPKESEVSEIEKEVEKIIPRPPITHLYPVPKPK